MKNRKPGPKKFTDVAINIKMSKRDLVQLKRQAQMFFDGNLSGFLRHAGLNYKAPLTK